MIKGIIFDADGTLLDSMEIWDRAASEYLIARGVTPEVSLAEKIEAMTIQEGREYLKKQYGLTETAQEIGDGIQYIIEDFYRYEVELKCGAEELTRDFREKNIPMTIATSGDRQLLEAALTRLGIAQRFDAVFTCGELNRGKTFPDVFHACRQSMNTQPEETLIFEDALYAVKTAKAAGFVTVAVYDSSSRKHRKELQHIADYYFESLTDAAAVLQDILNEA